MNLLPLVASVAVVSVHAAVHSLQSASGPIIEQVTDAPIVECKCKEKVGIHRPGKDLLRLVGPTFRFPDGSCVLCGLESELEHSPHLFNNILNANAEASKPLVTKVLETFEPTSPHATLAPPTQVLLSATLTPQQIVLDGEWRDMGDHRLEFPTDGPSLLLQGLIPTVPNPDVGWMDIVEVDEQLRPISVECVSPTAMDHLLPTSPHTRYVLVGLRDREVHADSLIGHLNALLMWQHRESISIRPTSRFLTLRCTSSWSS